MHRTVRNCTGCAMYIGTFSMYSNLDPRLSNQNTVLTAATAVAVVVLQQLPSIRLDTIPLHQRTALTGFLSLWSLLCSAQLAVWLPVCPRGPPILTSLTLMSPIVLSPIVLSSICLCCIGSRRLMLRCHLYCLLRYFHCLHKRSFVCSLYDFSSPITFYRLRNYVWLFTSVLSE